VKRESLKAQLILEENRWTIPQVGTEKQHEYAVSLAQFFRYHDLRSFVEAWPNFKKLNKKSTETLTTAEARKFILHVRTVRKRLYYKVGLSD
jgi:hypothetical protein